MGPKKQIFFLCTALIGLLLVVKVVSLDGSSSIQIAVQNFGHVPVFGMISIVLLQIVRLMINPHQTRWLFYVYAFILTTILGAITELMQLPTSRDADPMDLLMDMIGAFGFLSIAASQDKRLKKNASHNRILLIAGVLILVSTTIPLVAVIASRLYRDYHFPFISGFESRWSSGFVGVKDAKLSVVPTPREWKNNTSKRSAYVSLLADRKYPGIHIEQVYPNWSEYRFFLFELYNPMKSDLQLTVRIHDRSHNGNVFDRFNKRYSLTPGTHRVCIPLDSIRNAPQDRLMRMTEIQSIIWFCSQSGDKREYYIDNITLSDSCENQ